MDEKCPKCGLISGAALCDPIMIARLVEEANTNPKTVAGCYCPKTDGVCCLRYQLEELKDQLMGKPVVDDHCPDCGGPLVAPCDHDPWLYCVSCGNETVVRKGYRETRDKLTKANQTIDRLRDGRRANTKRRRQLTQTRNKLGKQVYNLGKKLAQAKVENDGLKQVLIRFGKADRALDREIAKPYPECRTDAIEAEHTEAYEVMYTLAEQLADAATAVEEKTNG